MLRHQFKAPSEFAFTAGRELGWRDKWILVARNETEPTLRRTYIGFARECNRQYLRSLRHAIEAQPQFYR